MLSISGVILAGGQSLRMNGEDKGLLKYNGQTMVQCVASAFKGACDIRVNANRHHDAYQNLGFEVFQDVSYPDIGDYAGPLLGILSGLQTAKEDWVLFSPCDTPNLPQTYLAVMAQTASDQLAKACVVFDGERQQNLHLLLHKSFAEHLLMFLLSGKRKTYQWLDSIQALEVKFAHGKDDFKNINRPEDL